MSTTLTNSPQPAGVAPDTWAAMQLTSLVDEAAVRLVRDVAARDAYDGGDDELAAELEDAATFSDGWLAGLSEALGLLLGRDPLELVTAARGSAEQARSVVLTGMEMLFAGAGATP